MRNTLRPQMTFITRREDDFLAGSTAEAFLDKRGLPQSLDKTNLLIRGSDLGGDSQHPEHRTKLGDPENEY
jgi:hypothetical protein